MTNTPFFSVIIPTYNPRRFLIKLLASINKNNCTKDIEVIVSDDVSTESFDDILAMMRIQGLQIRKICNDKHYGFPRNGRQNGADAANGKWLCFADQDDYFLDHAFDRIKQHIEDNNIKRYLATDFYIESSSTGERTITKWYKGWTHGKFYEREFWDKYKLGYDDVEYCEDINLSTKVSCALTVEREDINRIEEPVYVWNRRNDSLCDDDYFIKSLSDYIKGTQAIVIDYLDTYKDDQYFLGVFSIKFINGLYHLYFYSQNRMIYNNKVEFIKALNVFHPIYEKFKEITEFDNQSIIQLTNTELLQHYNLSRSDDFEQLPFIEQISFKDWMEAYL